MMDQAQVVQQKGQLLIRNMKRERYTKSSASFKVIPSNGRNESVKGITDQIPLCKWVGQNSSHIRKLYEILILFSFQNINLYTQISRNFQISFYFSIVCNIYIYILRLNVSSISYLKGF